MLNVTIDEIQRNLLKYLRQVEEGETLVIVRSHQAIALSETHYQSPAVATIRFV